MTKKKQPKIVHISAVDQHWTENGDEMSRTVIFGLSSDNLIYWFDKELQEWVKMI